MTRAAVSPIPIVYPESDGRPMADNTVQFRWIVLLKENLNLRLDHFVAGDLLWYPVEGEPWTRAAPDVLVALGRPKGDRGSYRQWDEGGVAPAVVFEVLSPGNTPQEMREKLLFYQRYGVAEYYVVDPDVETVEIYLRRGGELRHHALEGAHTSALLGVSFERSAEGRLVLRDAAGVPFLSYEELASERDEVRAERDEVRAERDEVTRENERLRAKLRAAGIDPDEPG